MTGSTFPPRATHLYQKTVRKNTAYPLFMKLHPSGLFFKLHTQWKKKTDKALLKPDKTKERETEKLY